MLVADLFYKITHSRHGTPTLNPTAAGLGMAAALLAELVISEHLDVAAPPDGADEVITVARRAAVPEDLLSHQVFDTLRNERQFFPVADWLRYLSRTAETDVAERLVRARQLTKQVRGLRKNLSYTPVDGSTFEGAYGHLCAVLMHTSRIDDQSWYWCAALCYTTGLHNRMLDADPQSQARAYLTWMINQLPLAGRALIHTTRALIGNAVYTHR